MKLDGKDGAIAHFLMDVSARGREECTLTSYRHRLCRLISLLSSLCSITDLEMVTVLHLRQCVQHLLDADVQIVVLGRAPVNGKKLDVATIKGYIRVWKAFFHWCYQEELIDSDVVARLRSPKATKRVLSTFTVEHINIMLSQCDTSTDMGYRNYVIVLLLLDTGLRLAEIVSLDLGSVHERYIKVYGKGRKEREIGIRPEISKLLWKYVQKYRKPSDADEKALFIGRGGRLSSGGVKQVIRSIKVASGLEGVRVSAHTFRHTFAKWYLEQGGDLFKLSREMGHSSITITKGYLEDFHSSDARKDHDSFSPIARLDLKKQRKRKKQSVE